MHANLQDVSSAAKLTRTLDVRARARADAAEGRPAFDARELSATERDIAAFAAAAQARLDAQRHKTRDEVERALRAQTPAPADLAGPLTEAQLALRRVEGRVAHDYAAARERARAARVDLAAFRAANSLNRPAVYPASRLLQAGLLLCAAVFEALFSATLFAETDARGLLGGAVTAIGLSAANVVLGFLAGFLGLRYVQHVAAGPRIGGGLAFAALAGIALFLNFFAAIWRQHLAAPLAPGETATFWNAMFSLTEPQAVILLMLGGGVWVFATLKGYSGFDDPYPDFGKMDRVAEAARLALSDLHAESRADLEAPIETAQGALADRVGAVREALAAMSRLYDKAATDLAAIDSEARRVADSCEAAIHLYRQENLAARDGAPAPAYFSEPPPRPDPPPDALGAAADLIETVRAALADAQSETARGLADLMARLDAAQARLDAPAEAQAA